MALHVIVGKRPVGMTTAAELVARGHDVRVLSRSGGESTAEIEDRQVDATDAEALTAADLGARGHDVRVRSRSGGESAAEIEHRQVEATDAEALTAAARGAAALYNAVNPAYHRWATDWPPVAAALLDAAERTGAVLVTMGNLYVYGRPAGPMTPDSPLAATDTKGRVRLAMWTDALAAHEAGRVRVTE